jgi:Protein of unknown function (DUF3667)
VLWTVLREWREIAGSVCLNCGSDGVRDFCPRCGQEAADASPTLGAWLREAWSEYWALDGKVVRSIAALLLRPGYLTGEWLAGRRTLYVRPFPLFLLFLPVIVWVEANTSVRVFTLVWSVPCLAVASFLLIEQERPRPSMVPHFVLSLHVHSVLLSALLAEMGFDALLGRDIYVDGPLWWLFGPVYGGFLFLSDRRVNQGPSGRSALRVIGVATIHLGAVLAGGAAVFLVAIAAGVIEVS